MNTIVQAISKLPKYEWGQEIRIKYGHDYYWVKVIKRVAEVDLQFEDKHIQFYYDLKDTMRKDKYFFKMSERELAMFHADAELS